LDYPVCTADSLSKKGHAQRLWFLNALYSKFSKEDRMSLGELLNYIYLHL